MAQDMQQVSKEKSIKREVVVRGDRDDFSGKNDKLPAFVGTDGWPIWFKWFLLIVGIALIGVFLYFWLFK